MAQQEGEEYSDALRYLINGYQVSQAIHVAVTLGIPDLLAHGPPAMLAEATAPPPKPLPSSGGRAAETALMIRSSDPSLAAAPARRRSPTSRSACWRRQREVDRRPVVVREVGAALIA